MEFENLKEKVNALENKSTDFIFRCEHCDYLGKTEKKIRKHFRNNHKDTDLDVTLEDECCLDLECKFDKLERHVAKKQEAIENRDVDEYIEEWDEGETFEQLIRRISLIEKRKECDFEGKNIMD